jgi:hypothetical protein
MKIVFLVYERFTLISYDDRFTKPHRTKPTLLPNKKKMILKNNENLIVFFGLM